MKIIAMKLAMVVFMLSIKAISYGQEIVLPLKTTSGKSAFYKSNMQITKVTDSALKNVPTAGITSYDLKKYVFSAAQNEYERFTSGEISLLAFNARVTLFRLDTSNITAQRIPKNAFYAFVGLTSNGKKVIVIDANNNLDFADDQSYEYDMTPPKYGLEEEVEVKIAYYDKSSQSVKEAIIPILLLPFGKFEISGTQLQKQLNIMFVKASSKEANITVDNQRFRFIADHTNYGLYGFENQKFKITSSKNDSAAINYTYLPNQPFPILQHQYKVNYLHADSIRLQFLGNSYHSYGKINTIAPDFAAADFINNKVFSLKANRGKYILLDFWGSWCGPCIQLLPRIAETYRQLDQRKVMLVSIALDDQKDLTKTRAYIEKFGMIWPQLWQDKTSERTDGSLTILYQVQNFPTTILIDPDGKIIYRGIGEDGFLKAKKIYDTIL